MREPAYSASSATNRNFVFSRSSLIRSSASVSVLDAMAFNRFKPIRITTRTRIMTTTTTIAAIAQSCAVFSWRGLLRNSHMATPSVV